MKTPAYLALLVPVLGLFLLSCSDLSNPVSEPLSSPAEEGPAGTWAKTVNAQVVNRTILVNNFWVTFVGRDFNENSHHTTFAYNVEETEGGPDNFHFSIDIPECAGDLQAYEPTEGVSLNSDPNTGFINGIDWHPSTNATGPFSFSITFPGDVPLGAVDLAIKSSETHEVNLWFGPCGGVYNIEGTVFADADNYGEFDPTESGIANVIIELVQRDDENNLTTITETTDAEGVYEFTDLHPLFSYTVQISDANVDLKDANSFTPTTPLSFIVDPDGTKIYNFGFDANVDGLITQFEAFADPIVGQLTSTAEDLKYWTGAVRAFKNGTKNADLEIGNYLVQIQTLYLPDPFFGNLPADPQLLARAALDILTEQPKNPLDLLEKELLTAELNMVSGRVICTLEQDPDDPDGLICVPLEDQTLLETLIAWGESIVVNDPDYQPSSSKNRGALEVASTSDARDVFAAYNSSGGGTGGNE